MRWKLFNLENSFIPSRKCDGVESLFPWAAAAKGTQEIGQQIGASLWQQHLLHEEQDFEREKMKWQEDMYNKYQSPQALMSQYRKAGLNPFLMSENGAVGSIPSASGGSPSAPSVPQGFPASNFANEYAQFELAAATSGNQKAQTSLNYVMAINDAFIKGGYKAGISMISQLMPQLNALDLDSHTVMSMTGDLAKSAAAKSVIDGITADWFKEHGKEQMSTNLEKINQEIAESVGRLGLMSSQADLNRQKIKESASVIARNFAEAFELTKQGEYFDVSASTARQIQKYVVSMYASNSSIIGHAAQRDSAVFSSERELLSWYESLEAREQRLAAGQFDSVERADYLHRLIQMTLGDLGQMIHVNGGFNWSDVRGAFNSYSESYNTNSSTSRNWNNNSNSNSNTSTNINYNYRMKE